MTNYTFEHRIFQLQSRRYDPGDYFRYCFAHRKPFISVRPFRKFATVSMELPGVKVLDVSEVKQLRALIGPQIGTAGSVTVQKIPVELLLKVIVVMERVGQGAIARSACDFSCQTSVER